MGEAWWEKWANYSNWRRENVQDCWKIHFVFFQCGAVWLFLTSCNLSSQVFFGRFLWLDIFFVPFWPATNIANLPFLPGWCSNLDQSWLHGEISGLGQSATINMGCKYTIGKLTNVTWTSLPTQHFSADMLVFGRVHHRKTNICPWKWSLDNPSLLGMANFSWGLLVQGLGKLLQPGRNKDV